jgi:hypothetical protein
MELTIPFAVLKRIFSLFLVVLLGRFFYRLIHVRMKVRRFMKDSGLVRNDNAFLGYNAGLTERQVYNCLTVPIRNLRRIPSYSGIFRHSPSSWPNILEIQQDKSFQYYSPTSTQSFKPKVSFVWTLGLSPTPC